MQLLSSHPNELSFLADKHATDSQFITRFTIKKGMGTSSINKGRGLDSKCCNSYARTAVACRFMCVLAFGTCSPPCHMHRNDRGI